ncbi:MAG TPA: cytochrome c peroxidase [Steroidobacteraceae bacterium]|nr:cytochrome c peroxidase [Steroidobacteraceae bacterium]
MAGGTSASVALIVVALISVALIGGAKAEGSDPAAGAPFYANTFEKVPAAAALTALGRELFSDPALSASGKMACANCHDPKHAFGPPNDLPVQRGGVDGRSFGVRAVPSLKYTQNVPPFTEHFIGDEGDDSVDQGPAGGRTWDGRAQSFHDQARLPLFSPFEMANSSADAVVARVRPRYAGQFRAAFGKKIFDESALAFKGILMALEAYQQSPAEFYPYSSKYDAWLRHETALSPQELRGLAAFNDPGKGNCARCHPSTLRKGAFPQFTDFGFAAVGAPRNAAIPANADPQYHDLGLCGPLRMDLKDRREYCGLFRTPSLRNVAMRPVFFHNGVLHSLSEAVRFYAERDTQPQKWYSRAGDGSTFKFDDLPPAYAANLDAQAPFDRHPGEPPAMSEDDVQDIVVFLQTLSDGYR